MKILIHNWAKYHHRKDVKVMHWFRVSADIPTDPKMFGLPVESKWLFITLLSLCAKAKSDTLEMECDFIGHIAGLSKVEKYLELLVKRGLVTLVAQSWDTDGTELVRTRPSTEQNRTKQDIESTNVDSSAVVKKLPTSAAESDFMPKVLANIKTPTKQRWIALYQDTEWIQRTLTRAIGYYQDNPRKMPKSVRGWSQALSSWLDREWAKSARFTKGSVSASTTQEDLEAIREDAHDLN